MNKKIIIAGDLHGVWGPLNSLINGKKPEIILQCGDFGWWPKFHNTKEIWSGEYEDLSGKLVNLDPWQHHMARRIPKPWDQFGIKAKDTKIYWCDGNHEDHWDLIEERNYMKAPCEMMPNVYYMKRGSILQLPDKRNVLFMGGGDSIDKNQRTLGHDWFPEELINHGDVHELPDMNIDIVISHTCPLEFHEEMLKKGFWETKQIYIDKIKDPSAHALSYILNKYKPKLWYFAHFHVYVKGWYRDTTWYCLDMIGRSNWWSYLEDK